MFKEKIKMIKYYMLISIVMQLVVQFVLGEYM